MHGVFRRVERRSRLFLRRADDVLAREREIGDLSDAPLQSAAGQLAERFRRRRESPVDLDRALAILREVAFRKLGERPYREQIAGALACDAGCICEMATGEGKTLVAAIAATLAGWRGRGCHVVTVNDYLAGRDAEWMGNLFRFCGLSVGFIQNETPPVGRRLAYAADITYATNKEVTADYLRDRLVLGGRRNLPEVLLDGMAGRFDAQAHLVQRGLHCAIVDEADSVLLDEAVTPLIISGEAPNAEQVQCYAEAAAIAGRLKPVEHYAVNRRYNEITMTDVGRDGLAREVASLGGVWRSMRRAEELVTQALSAREFFHRDMQYVVADGKIVIVDESTGRTMPDRTWRDGLHQAIEAREGVTINPPKTTHARVSFQRFFRMYDKLSGLTGTAVEGRGEFWRVYGLPVTVIPTHRPVLRRRHPDRCYATGAAKWRAVVEDVRRVYDEGRPVLIGTRSVKDSEHVSSMLSAAGLEHRVLNAVRHAEEAQIVAEAGQPGAITVATNMAGRGTDIKLGRGVAELGGLHVIATERHAAGRIDRQLFGRAARQGDPGSAIAMVSLDDELIARYAPVGLRILRKVATDNPEGFSNRSARGVFDRAQRRAQRIAFAQRRAGLQTDDWLDEFLGFAGDRF
ncbi:MAG: translocase [Phycisphaerales bacterium]|nr:translocase [Phycisphaerales bacterium]